MQTIGIVLNIDRERTDEFERAFREHEAPIWADLHGRGLLTMATLSRLDITTRPAEGATRYLVVAIFSSDEGHHVHDSDPRFEAWNKQADAYQLEEPFVFGGDTVVHQGA
jgi:quinol monooxygenase YgiN